jgi:hypothetical protein
MGTDPKTVAFPIYTDLSIGLLKGEGILIKVDNFLAVVPNLQAE